MSYNGSGTYALAAGNPVVTGTNITITWANGTLNDIASGLTNALCKDGQSTPTANLKMGGYKFTGLGVGSARTDSLNIAQLQDGALIWLGTGGGTADVITAATSPVITAYAAGQTFRFISSGANTTNVTLNISGVGAKAITKNGAVALAAGDIPSGAVCTVVYDGTQFQLIGVFSGTLNSDLVLAAGKKIIGEGTTDDAHETTLDFGEPTADRTITLPNATGTAALTSDLPAAATQAEQETGTSTTVYVSPGRQKNHASAAKAWGIVTFSGGSTPTLGASSYGVTSITDSGLGVTTINLSTAFSSAVYCPIVTSLAGTGNLDANVGTMLAGSFVVNGRNSSSGAATDFDFSFVVFGDQ